MKISFKTDLDIVAIRNSDVNVIIAGVRGRQLSGYSSTLDTLTKGRISEALELGELDEAVGSLLTLDCADVALARRIVLVQLGEIEAATVSKYSSAAVSAVKSVKTLRAERVLWCLDPHDSMIDTVLALNDADYTFDAFKRPGNGEKKRISEVTFPVLAGREAEAETELLQAQAIADGVALCRNLGNLPPNICTPQYLADTALKLGNNPDVNVTVLDADQITVLGMNSFMAVAKGSVEPPKLITIEYRGGASEAQPIVLVGKGITFDSGGVSIKPGEAMDEMKYDMCGAASVLGTMAAVVGMRLPINLNIVIPACENMPAGNALKPGDIITSMHGTTIEVLNTDAEGRLILCDALTYAKRFNPAVLIDVATLTGACVVALGHVHSGLYSNDEQLADDLIAAGKACNDSVWRMPLDTEYYESLKSNFADLQNIGGRPGGSITAACFLEKFTKGCSWAHLDIAGTAWKSGKDKGATGRPVRLLTRFLIGRSRSIKN